MQNWNPAWSNYCSLSGSGAEWFFLGVGIIVLLLFIFCPIKLRRCLWVPLLVYLLMGYPQISASAAKISLPKKPSAQVYFVLPEYEADWKVSLAGVAAPTGPTFLYSFAKSIGFGNYDGGRCADLAIHKEDNVLAEINSGDLVCVTTTVSNYRNSLSFIEKVKEQGATVAIGGPWASVRSKQIYLHHPEIDYVVIGEGEAPLQEILFNKAEKGILRRCPLPITELPALDFSGWADADLQTYYQNYISMLQTGKYGLIPEQIPVFVFYQSSRGCVQHPRCNFCGSRLGNKLVFRTSEQFYKNIENIVQQVSWINPQIHIFDCSDSFVSSIGRFKEDFHAHPCVNFTVYARVDEIDQKSAKFLQQLGVTKVSLGIETGSTKALADIGKNTTIEQNVRAIETLKDVGISVYVNLIYGLPGETPKDLGKTVDHFVELSRCGEIYRVAGRVMTPLPNAKWFFDLLKIRPELRTEDDWLDLPKLQAAWLESMTKVTLEDIQKAHSCLVHYAHEKSISVSSEIVRGIV